MISIKKRISLEFLGDDYKESYVVLRSLPLNKYEEYVAKTKQLEKESKEEPLKAVYFILDLLKEYFIEGKIFNDGKLEEFQPDNFGDLDFSAVQEIFNKFSGVNPDPK